jgi:hypothetical protein
MQLNRYKKAKTLSRAAAAAFIKRQLSQLERAIVNSAALFLVFDFPV